MQSSSNRAIFANQLRAIAIISVMLVHWFGVFWLARDTVSAVTFAPPPVGPSSQLLNWITFPTLNYGPLGVSIFFLISGFVIPFSLAKASPIEFLFSRALRIYPTYIIATLVSFLAVWLSTKYWGTTFKVDTNTVIHNLALIHSNTYYGTIDLVNWSLSVELKFYFVSALLYKAVRSGKMQYIIAYAIAVLVFCKWFPQSMSPMHFAKFDLSIESFKTELMLTLFMFIGTCFYHHYTRLLSTKMLSIYAASLLAACLLCWPNTEWRGGIPYVPLNYLYGLVVFIIAYRLRTFAKPFWPLDFIAKISYPLYIIHSLVGYSFMRAAIDLGAPFKLAVFGAFMVTTILSYGLHLSIEKNTMHLGRSLFVLFRKTKVVTNTPKMQ